jgi:peroxiredoxin
MLMWRYTGCTAASEEDEAMKQVQVGDTIRDFTLPTSTGKPVTLSEALRDGPVVLAWYLFDFGRV